MVERIILPPIFEFKKRSFVQKIIIIMNLLCVRLPHLQSLAFVENRRCGFVFQLIYNNTNTNKRIDQGHLPQLEESGMDSQRKYHKLLKIRVQDILEIFCMKILKMKKCIATE